MGYYRSLADYAWQSTIDFAKRRGILLAPIAAVLGGVVASLARGELDSRAPISALVGPLALLFAVLLVNFLKAPAHLDAQRRTHIAERDAIIQDLEEQTETMRRELIPGITLESGNTPEYEREMEVAAARSPQPEDFGRDVRRVKLVKVTNVSSRSLVVHAQIVEVAPPLVQGAGPPIRLNWRDFGWGSHTLSAHEFDYVVVSPPIPDADLWVQTYTRTITVSVWVGGQLGATKRFRLDNLRVDGYPWISMLDDEGRSPER